MFNDVERRAAQKPCNWIFYMPPGCDVVDHVLRQKINLRSHDSGIQRIFKEERPSRTAFFSTFETVYSDTVRKVRD